MAPQPKEASAGTGDEPLYDGLSYVTAREVWQELKTLFVMWVFFAVVSVALGFFIDFGFRMVAGAGSGVSLPSVFSEFTPPSWLSFPIAFAAGGWLLRGKNITVPNVGLVVWVSWALCLGVSSFVSAHAPWWAAMTFLWALIFCLRTLESLAAKGRHNRVRFGSESEEPSVDVNNAV